MNNQYWWEVVIDECCQGASPLFSAIIQNKPYTSEHKNTFMPIYNPVNGGAIFVTFVLSSDQEGAMVSAKNSFENYTRTQDWRDAWGTFGDRYRKQVKESAERDRLSKPATVGDIEKLISAIQDGK